ncbi:hypothetical protein SAMN05443634_10446 [Chishuiella changwenlii]|uniref:TraB family protein n=1 Tax=Chishuiella changwenlii TaxID=1434701 RepID=A0A1M6VUV8_9FLAO|nr:DUF5694 domain-containing protein [Chishuiella changwenlii]GGE89874.1 hypothetical protein GCM10010984_04460 [Chishuiella changwenlii]SHK85211.1 hypothetical protein SAMN05443634_10446 [Chishuiella changwenlii]
MKNLFITIVVILSCTSLKAQKAYQFQTKFDDVVPVLNVGTFHMGYTSDANKVNFDENNKENVRQVHEIAKKIAAFKPTIILVEMEPYRNKKLAASYQSYLDNPKMKFDNPDEIELLAYEVGRLSGTKQIYGIDYQQGYYYAIHYALKDQQDVTTYKKYEELMTKNEKLNQIDEDNMNVKDLLWLNNQPEYLDYLINVNADLMTTVSVNGYSLGTEQASKFYNRNLMMFANMNNIPITKGDRIFILMGATHTAFFKDFLRRSPKFKEVNTLDYLK